MELSSNKHAICKSVNKYTLIDLNTVKIKKDKDRYEVSFRVGNEKIVFPMFHKEFRDNLDFLAKGSYGSVYSLKTYHKGAYYGIIFKISIDNKIDEDEIKAMELLKSHKVNCGVILARLIDIPNTPNVTMMNIMNGDLTLLQGKVTIHEMISIFYSCLQCLDCLVSRGLGYLDIKLKNLLFHCSTNEDYTIVLGDIGSIGKLGETQISTYVPYEQRFRPRTQFVITENAMVYLLGAVMLGLMDARPWSKSIMTTFFVRYDNYNMDAIQSEINEFLFKKKFHKKVMRTKTLDLHFHDILNTDPTKRPTIKQLLALFKPPKITYV